LRKLFWIALVYVATRDIILSLFLGTLVGLGTEIFHNSKRFYVLKYDREKASKYFLNKRRCSSVV
jgi:hypothetical protein